MYKFKKLKHDIEPEPYDGESGGACIEEDSNSSEIDYPGEEHSEFEYESDLESIRDDVSSVQSEPPQYIDLESNLDEETDFAEINF